MIEIEIADEQSLMQVDEGRLKRIVRAIIADHGVRNSRISIAIVDDPTIHRLNRQYLQHDYPTDVLSFVLDDQDDFLEGEVIVSTETAASEAADFDWPAEDELLLYVVHGILHLIGFDDKTDAERTRMRGAERSYLMGAGVTMPAGSSDSPGRGDDYD